MRLVNHCVKFHIVCLCNVFKMLYKYIRSRFKATIPFLHTQFFFVFCDNLEIKCMGSSTIKIHNENDNSMNNIKAKSDIIKNLNTFTTILCYIRSPFRIKSVRIIFIIISINRIYES